MGGARELRADSIASGRPAGNAEAARSSRPGKPGKPNFKAKFLEDSGIPERSRRKLSIVPMEALERFMPIAKEEGFVPRLSPWHFRAKDDRDFLLRIESTRTGMPPAVVERRRYMEAAGLPEHAVNRLEPVSLSKLKRFLPAALEMGAAHLLVPGHFLTCKNLTEFRALMKKEPRASMKGNAASSHFGLRNLQLEFLRANGISGATAEKMKSVPMRRLESYLPIALGLGVPELARPSYFSNSKTPLEFWLKVCRAMEKKGMEPPERYGELPSSLDGALEMSEMKRAISSVAARYWRAASMLSISREDVEHFGRIGVMKAYEKYDPLKEFGFVDYCKMWMRAEILRNIWQDGGATASGTTMGRFRDFGNALEAYLEGRSPEALTRSGMETYRRLKSGELKPGDAEKELFRMQRKTLEASAPVSLFRTVKGTDDLLLIDVLESHYPNAGGDLPGMEVLLDRIFHHIDMIFQEADRSGISPRKLESLRKEEIVFRERWLERDGEIPTVKDLAERLGTTTSTVYSLESKFMRRLLPRLRRDPVLREWSGMGPW